MTNPMIDSMWLQVTATAYAIASTKGQEKMKYRYVDEIARSLLEHFPNSAHMYALERVTAIGELQVDMWRQVLTELDRLEAKNGSTQVGGDSTGREGQQKDSRRELSATDGESSRRPSASSGVDESAL